MKTAPFWLSFIAAAAVFALFPAMALAAGGEASEGLNLRPLAAGLAIAIGALGGALAQGRLAAAAMEGIARNPQAGKTMFVPFIIGLALIESLVIYCLVIAFTLAQ